MMPAPGDQHKNGANPFSEPTTRLSEYTACEVATLQSRLEKQLGPEYLSSRSGPSGQKVHYVAAEKVIMLANEIFGFNGWSSSIQTVQIDFVDEHPQTFKISLGLSVIVRVTLRDGTYHEDIGYGHIENCKGKAAAFEKAKKEGTTDGLKRALRNFGNVLGNCIYDKAYVEKVSRMKVPPNGKRFDESRLHRHADYALPASPLPPKAEVGTAAAAAAAAATTAASALSTPAPTTGVVAKMEPSSSTDTSAFSVDPFDEDLLGDFDEADFCVAEDGHPDEIRVPEVPIPSLPAPQPYGNAQSRNTSPVRQMPPPQNGGMPGNSTRPAGPTVANGVPSRAPQTPNSMNNRTSYAGPAPGRPYQPASNPSAGNQFNRPPGQRAGFGNGNGNGANSNANGNMNGNGNGNGANSNANGNMNGNGNGNGSKPVATEVKGTAWLSARAVAKAGDIDPLKLPISPTSLFNPKTESPSIRKTPGIDHSSSKPIPKMNRPAGLATAAATATTPSVDRVMGGAAASSTANGGATQSGLAGGGGGPLSAAGGMPRGGMNGGMGLSEMPRRIGAPASTASPLANRGQFRPPPMKRGPPTDPVGGISGNGRPALADVSSNIPGNGSTAVATASGGASGVDAKRQKIA